MPRPRGKKCIYLHKFEAEKAMPDLMNTHEVADYLRIKERKVYDLLRKKQIPCTRVTGKWLFPKHQIDQWLAREADYPRGDRDMQVPLPAVVAGSHDPLLDWCMRESGCELAMLSGGSLDGLRRFAKGEALATGIHILDPGDGTYNVSAVKQACEPGPGGYVLVEWAWRRQGLVLAEGNPKKIDAIEDLRKVRVVVRQPQAGSQALFEHLLEEAELELGGLNVIADPARNETDLGLAIQEGKADAGLAIEAAARRFKLDFVPLWHERFDLLVRRRDYFEPPFQKIMTFARSEAFRERAKEMGGYDIGSLGAVHLNI